MSPKVLVFLAVFCVVKASVIHIDVYDDEPDTQLTQSMRNCNDVGCNRLCRIIGFSGGSCDNDQCRCARRTPDQGIEDEPENVLPQELNGCFYRECERRCRRHGYSGGACVDGRCRCDDNFLSAEHSLEKTSDEDETPQAVSGCFYRECERRCRRQGFSGGACVDGRCRCDNNNLNAEHRLGQNSDENEIPQAVSGCFYRECERRCRRRGYSGGACVDGRCRCDNNFLSAEHGLEQISDEDEIPQAVRGCFYGICEQRCRRLGYPGGACIDGRCKCNNNFRNAEYSLGQTSDEDETPQAVSGCFYRLCEQRCRRLGYPGGACIDGRCKCEKSLNSEFNTADESEAMVPEYFRGCYQRVCELGCHRRGFSGGACSNGLCKCDNAQATSVEDSSTPAANNEINLTPKKE